jgi:hypothetical protein
MSAYAPDVAPEAFPAQRYEELRSAALGVATAAASGRGLALLMRQGMAAWMRAWASCVAPRPSPVEPGKQAKPPAVCPELVTVLAQMAMAAAQQGGRA